MPTTTYIDHDARVLALQARTDAAGTDVVDVTGADLRTAAELFTEGAVDPDAYKPAAGAGLSIDIGSGAAGNNLAVIAGENPGQGNYLVAVDAPKTNIPLAAADLTHARIDEIWLAIEDDSFDSSGHTIAHLAVRQGDPAAHPVAPGGDTQWAARWKIATVTIPAGAAGVDTAHIHDDRTRATVRVSAAGAVTTADLHAHTAAHANPHHVTAPQVGAYTKHETDSRLAAQKTANDGRYAGKGGSSSNDFRVHTLYLSYVPPTTGYDANLYVDSHGRIYKTSRTDPRYALRTHTHTYLTQTAADHRYSKIGHAHNLVYVSGQSGARKITMGTGGPPSSGSNGDIHLQYV